ncbi:MAG TPA: hypothetical protein VFA63_05840 [Pseudonocardiaceae bacterium]|nr:hypothetical protein [Pseudonocardiaceae bacterium]
MTHPVLPAVGPAAAAAMPETPDLDGAYPRLSQNQLDTLEPYGER